MEDTLPAGGAAGAAPVHDDPFGWVGHVLEAKYAVEAVVGEGGFAVVYRGHHKGLDDKVAVKCLKIPKRLAGEDRERFLQSFLAEGRLLHKLSRAHAGIVQALDVGATEAPNGTWTPFLVLEWLDGRTLEDELKATKPASPPLPGKPARSLESALTLLEPAARALASAHAQGVAHRDVKPANLFVATVAGKRVLKVVDFGIAKVIAESSDLQRAHEATGASLQAFTPRYGAPEQFDRRFGATGPWTDVFALALIFVEVVAGRSAMQGDTVQLFVASSNPEHRPTLRAHGVDEGDAIEAVLARALAVSPKERYQDAGAFWDALEHAAATADTVLSLDGPRAAAGLAAPSARTRRDGAAAVLVPASTAPTALAPVAPSAAAASAPGPIASGAVTALAPAATGIAAARSRAPAASAVTAAPEDPVADALAPRTSPAAPASAPAPSRMIDRAAASVSSRPKVARAIDRATPMPAASGGLGPVWLLAGLVALVGGVFAWTRFGGGELWSTRTSPTAPTASALDVDASTALAAPDANAPLLIRCVPGFTQVPGGDDAFAVCAPDALAAAPAVDNTRRAGDLDVHVWQGPATRASFAALFAEKKRSDLDQRFVTATVPQGDALPTDADTFEIYGSFGGRRFAERYALGKDRFAAVRFTYPEGAADAGEGAFAHMLIGFAQR